MADNLTISIGADTSKASVEIDLLKAKIRDLNSEVRKLATESQRRGEIMPRLPEARAELNAANAQLRTFNATTRETTAANAAASLSFAELGKQIGQFAKVSGVAIGGIKALRFGMAGLVGSQIIRGLTTITDKITELGEQSKKGGLDPGTIRQFGKALGETGGKAEEAAGLLGKLTEPFAAEKKLEMRSWWGDAKAGAESGLPPATAYAKALNELHINMQQFGTDAKGLRELSFAVAQGLVRLADSGKIDDANRLSVELLGKNWREVGAAVREFAAAKNAAAAAPPGGDIASPEAQAAAEKYRIALSELSRQWDAFTARLATTGAPALAVNALTGLVTVAEGLVIFFGTNVPNAVQALWDKLKEFGNAVGTIATAFQDAWTAAFNSVSQTIQSVIGWFDSLISKAKAVLSAIGAAVGNAPAGTAAPMAGFAGGGYVRGAGGPTSDSILARLSNGEFVMRAAAVRHWGSTLLDAMNRAAGGLSAPLVPRTRFASGGLVSAMGTTDGATVHLHLDGRSFPMRADNDVADSLIRTARNKQMLSAGRKPGWAAGRRYGG